MLDQNTDRMWFVIGAVIVGAAIIFIANGTLPTLFASISETFSGSSEQALHTIEDIQPRSIRKELVETLTLDDMHEWTTGQTTTRVSANSAIVKPDHEFMGGFYFTPDQIVKGVEYSLEFDMQKIDGEIYGIGGHLTWAEEVDVRIDGSRARSWSGSEVSRNSMNLANDWFYTRAYPNDTDKHHIEVHFVAGDPAGIDHKIYIQPNRSGKVEHYIQNGYDFEVLIENVRLYEIIEEE